MTLTLRSVLENADKQWGNRPYVFTRSNPGSGFVGKTFGEFASDVRGLAGTLIDRGFTGKNLMVCGENSYEWMVADLAVSAYVGASTVMGKDPGTLEPALALARLRSHMEKTDIAAVFYSEKLPQFQPSTAFQKLQEGTAIPFFSLQNDLYSMAVSGGESGIPRADADQDILCKIFFTSGTTGSPKAVMLSQKNIFAGVSGLSARAPMNETDVGYLFAPLSHTYGGIYNFIYSLIFGSKLYLCSDTNRMAEELQLVQPTVFCAVPLVLERFLAAAQVSGAPAATLKHIFGGKLRYLFCAGGPWSSVDRNCYLNAGLNLLEAYALTETASSLAISYSGAGDTESVGTVLENLEVRVDNPDGRGYGEILVRGDSVFLGYYRDDEATKAVVDQEGFFHTNDLGRMDETGRLYLAGRKKGPAKSTAGEFVSPTREETVWKTSEKEPT